MNNEDIKWDDEGKDEVTWDTETKKETVSEKPERRPSRIAQVVRALMRTSPLEQMRTAQYNLEQMQEGNFPDPTKPDFEKKYEEYIEPRETAIAKKGTLSQFSDLGMAGLAIATPLNIGATAKGLTKFGILEGLSELIGLNKKISDIQQPELQDIVNMAKFGVQGALSMQSWTPKFVKTAESRLAGNMIDSLIKPRHKDYLFGKQPGEAIAKEGIVAVNLRSLQSKVSTRKTELMQQISDVRNLPENFDKRVDLRSSLRPLFDSYKRLSKLGKETHATEIEALAKNIRDLQRLSKGISGKADQISISDAYKMKEAVSSYQSWNSESVARHQVNVALRKTYHNIDKAIDKTIPALEKLNDRVSNLISAEQAINNRIEMLQKSEPMPTVTKLLDLPFAALKSTLAKTTLAKLLAQQYKKSNVNIMGRTKQLSTQ